jgi:hypothetical protein
MRRFPKSERSITTKKSRAQRRATLLPLFFVLTVNVNSLGCAGVGALLRNPSIPSTPSPTPNPPTPDISVTVAPTSAGVLLGNAQRFAATATNTGDTSVTWSVDGVVGRNAVVGTITTAGVYTAPADLPGSAGAQVTATSRADATKTASASVSVGSDVRIGLPVNSATVELGATRKFRASIASAGHPDTAVQCPAACGVVDANGNYKAPQILPSPVTATLVAQSVADPSQQASATLTISSNFTVRISAPSSVTVNGTAAIAAIFTAVAGSNPTQTVTWSLSGSGCSGSSCGVLEELTQQSTGGGAAGNTATYSAPATAPSPATVTIAVTPLADPTKRTSVTLAIVSGGSVNISPATAMLAANHRITMAVQLGAATPQGAAGVNWSVNGVAGGNGAVGRICVVATNPCVLVTNGTAAQVDYIAPGAIPSPNPVTVQATNAADSTKQASAQITILNHVLVTVQPVNVTLAPLAVQGFTASVIGATDQSVAWQVQGTACAGTGLCGAIAQNGAYTAPIAAPAPNTLQVVAISEDDTSQSGSASVAISSGANILSLHPASVYAGGAEGFLLRVDGSGFAAAAPGPGSVLLIGGTARPTTCARRVSAPRQCRRRTWRHRDA